MHFASKIAAAAMLSALVASPALASGYDRPSVTYTGTAPTGAFLTQSAASGAGSATCSLATLPSRFTVENENGYWFHVAFGSGVGAGVAKRELINAERAVPNYCVEGAGKVGLSGIVYVAPVVPVIE
jgi:hypothetical protein